MKRIVMTVLIDDEIKMQDIVDALQVIDKPITIENAQVINTAELVERGVHDVTESE